MSATLVILGVHKKKILFKLYFFCGNGLLLGLALTHQKIYRADSHLILKFEDKFTSYNLQIKIKVIGQSSRSPNSWFLCVQQFFWSLSAQKRWLPPVDRYD
jgi:hypothetical protein